jgi:hypothetical protein
MLEEKLLPFILIYSDIYNPGRGKRNERSALAQGNEKTSFMDPACVL